MQQQRNTTRRRRRKRATQQRNGAMQQHINSSNNRNINPNIAATPQCNNITTKTQQRNDATMQQRNNATTNLKVQIRRFMMLRVPMLPHRPKNPRISRSVHIQDIEVCGVLVCRPFGFPKEVLMDVLKESLFFLFRDFS